MKSRPTSILTPLKHSKLVFFIHIFGDFELSVQIFHIFLLLWTIQLELLEIITETVFPTFLG